MSNVLPSESKQIGDYVYTVTKLDAVRGRRVALRLGKILAPAATRVAGIVDNAKKNAPKVAKRTEESKAAEGDEDNLLEGFNLSQFAEAIEAALTNCSEEDLDVLCDQFAASTCVEIHDDDGKTRNPKLSQVFGLHFAGKYGDLLSWLKFAVEVNFGNFSELLGKRRAS